MANVNLGNIKKIIYNGQEVTMPQGGGGGDFPEWLLPDMKPKGDLVLPEGMTSIGSSAFRSCYALTSIDLPQGVTSIGNYAFMECSGLRTVTIGEGLVTLPGQVFRYCTSLEFVHLPDSCTTVSANAFLDSKRGFTLSVKTGTTISMTGMPANVQIEYRP